MPATSDFVKKLYKCAFITLIQFKSTYDRNRMLEDQSFGHVVSWGPNGDCFVVKDMNEFTKSILPRMFKHSNFASFVRQLNKYDFHKVSRYASRFITLILDPSSYLGHCVSSFVNPLRW
ncbi:hypothetical protein HYDPIDRAFT_100219 [Hydnomerulius pinastri MD-312]|uniref:HSF-type DNA-binding domain-containing protein n=1 Tax=Hydnomerulius pinastri MD-312 TaxID=994086 RepID=A0A0C9V359_9AGAM|nr:hypothetical protein HYDPIDRAFT_100219 [Hydnomerulius pinastri MD-312]